LTIKGTGATGETPLTVSPAKAGVQGKIKVRGRLVKPGMTKMGLGEFFESNCPGRGQLLWNKSQMQHRFFHLKSENLSLTVSAKISNIFNQILGAQRILFLIFLFSIFKD
jgi:hypothetical protein